MALNKAAMCLVSWGDVPAPGSGVGPVGDVRLVADLFTIKQLPWHPSHAMVQVSCPWSALPVRKGRRGDGGFGVLTRYVMGLAGEYVQLGGRPVGNGRQEHPSACPEDRG